MRRIGTGADPSPHRHQRGCFRCRSCSSRGAGRSAGEIDRSRSTAACIANAVRLNGDLLGVAHGEVWRLVTSGFLHYGLIHILFNMYALYILGTWLERSGGRGRLAAVYGVSLLAGSLGALILSPTASPPARRVRSTA